MKVGRIEDFISVEEAGRLFQKFFMPLGASTMLWDEKGNLVFSDFMAPKAEEYKTELEEWLERAKREKKPFICRCEGGSLNCVIPLIYQEEGEEYFLGIASGCQGMKLVTKRNKVIEKIDYSQMLFQANLFLNAFQRRVRIRRRKRFRSDYFLILNRIEELTAEHVVKRYPRYRNLGLRTIFEAFNDLADSINFLTTLVVPGKIKYYAFRDPLTDTYNRHFLNEQLRLLRNHRDMFPVGILFADIDDLKLINDTLGHKEGDRYIVRMVEVLKASLRGGDRIFRVGGDEFIVLIPKANEEVMEKIIKRIRNNLNYLNEQEGLTPPLNVSLGFSLWNSPEEPFTEALDRADRAMYEEKKKSG
ncbi:MAG: hypothetical protein DSY35_01265 [Desulfurobacterium sp.]|nr:MAG: hypothetical protein DSY35_01265 [Desulfurobacterium sp.]